MPAAQGDIAPTECELLAVSKELKDTLSRCPNAATLALVDDMLLLLCQLQQYSSNIYMPDGLFYSFQGFSIDGILRRRCLFFLLFVERRGSPPSWQPP